MTNQKKVFDISEQPDKSREEAIKAICLIASCFVIFSFFASHANSQNLFGNPSCTSWKTTSNIEKTTWLNAFLAPLNLTNISRKKLTENKFSKLPSLETAVQYVDNFCEANANEFASLGAIQFLDKLTSGSQP